VKRARARFAVLSRLALSLACLVSVAASQTPSTGSLTRVAMVTGFKFAPRGNAGRP
jgi:hypothetical protein